MRGKAGLPERADLAAAVVRGGLSPAPFGPGAGAGGAFAWNSPAPLRPAALTNESRAK